MESIVTGTEVDAGMPAASRLAAEVKRRREAAGLSQPQLAQRIGYTRQYVSMAERTGNNVPSLDVIKAIDTALDTDGELVRLREQAKLEQQARRRSERPSDSLQMSNSSWAALTINDLPSNSLPAESVFTTPPGRFFMGATIDTRCFPVEVDERVVGIVPPNFLHDPFIRRPRRGLAIGVSRQNDRVVLFGLDNRQARQRLMRAPFSTKLLMSHAYALDDLSMAIIWAVSNLDEALLDDDAALTEAGDQLVAFERLSRSAAGKDIAADLAPVSRMWLGSNFCAQHVLRNSEQFTDPTLFWTREQRGEEASTWLLFAHKLAYLTETVQQQPKPNSGLSRTFCVPDTAVTESSRPEQSLLLLTAALMESFGIRVDVTTEPEYGSLEGFAFDGRRAVVANWVGTDGIWQVDITDHKPKIREFRDALGYAQAHSAIKASSARERLRNFAEHLGLDWSWLTRRCSELGEYGTAGLAQPRSRLLSLEGLDRACRFVGEGAGTGR
ncbi:helix-turn-helix transcriptional regulator [Saccharothrix lopnurensis]|uniref:Helix-turn-helix transcriptional regulator n=1 Tax=Saccharothrix lopnurensis TaxID=1670621 RepID=A0ABW1PA73_9PSEU